MLHITSKKDSAYYLIFPIICNTFMVITIGIISVTFICILALTLRRFCRPTTKFVASIWTPNCPFGTADRHFVFSRLIFLLFARLLLLLLPIPSHSCAFPFPYRNRQCHTPPPAGKSILFPDVASSFFWLPLLLSLRFFPCIFIYSSLWLCLASRSARSVCFSTVSLGNIFQYLHVNHEKHVKFVCLVKTSLLRRVPSGVAWCGVRHWLG